MKITAIEIRQHTFERGMRGYKTEDVDAFLVSLSQEWERVTSDYKMLKMQLEMSEKELGKLREVEMTLFRTLKMAEDTSTQITDQATKSGEQYLSEVKQKADDLLADARKRSALMVTDAENQASYLKDTILNDLKAMEHDFNALEHYKENLAVQIRALASSATDSVDRFEKKFAKQNLKGKIDEVATQINNDIQQRDAHQPDTASVPIAETIEQLTHPAPTAAVANDTTQVVGDQEKQELTPVEDGVPQHQMDQAQPEVTATVDEGREKKSGSFFDQI